MFCPKCGTSNDDSARFCAKCGTALAVAAAPAATASPGAAGGAGTGSMRSSAPGSSGQVVVGKNPTVALVLSIFLGFLGAGQFYNGDWKKGAAMAAASILLGVPSGGLVTLGVWVWSAIDGYQVASGKWKAW
ncbi:MAG TPA: TM2 domain-containing protein [Caldimonas sp.]|nr:TM2 domain-containing protein [Caldimonas sp.]